MIFQAYSKDAFSYLFRLIFVLFLLFYGNSLSANDEPNVSQKRELFKTKGHVSITHLDKDEWTITYELDKKVKMIMLGPQAKDYHDSSWELPQNFEIFTEQNTNYSYVNQL